MKDDTQPVNAAVHDRPVLRDNCKTQQTAANGSEAQRMATRARARKAAAHSHALQPRPPFELPGAVARHRRPAAAGPAIEGLVETHETKGGVSAAEAVKTQCVRRCLRRDDSGNTQGKGGVLAAEAAEPRKKSVSLPPEAA